MVAVRVSYWRSVSVPHGPCPGDERVLARHELPYPHQLDDDLGLAGQLSRLERRERGLDVEGRFHQGAVFGHGPVPGDGVCQYPAAQPLQPVDGVEQGVERLALLSGEAAAVPVPDRRAQGGHGAVGAALLGQQVDARRRPALRAQIRGGEAAFDLDLADRRVGRSAEGVVDILQTDECAQIAGDGHHGETPQRHEGDHRSDREGHDPRTDRGRTAEGPAHGLPRATGRSGGRVTCGDPCVTRG